MLVDVGCNSFQVHSVSKPQASPKRAAKKGGWASFPPPNMEPKMGGMSLASLSPATNDRCLCENMGKTWDNPTEISWDHDQRTKTKSCINAVRYQPAQAGENQAIMLEITCLVPLCGSGLCHEVWAFFSATQIIKQGFGDISLHQPLLPKWWFSYLWLLIWYPAQHAFYLFLWCIYV